MELIGLIILILVFFGFILLLIWLVRNSAKDLPKGKPMNKMSSKQLRKLARGKGRY